MLMATPEGDGIDIDDWEELTLTRGEALGGEDQGACCWWVFV